MTLEDLALAYELRVAGWSWKRVAKELGYDWQPLSSAVRYRVKHGLADPQSTGGRPPQRPSY